MGDVLSWVVGVVRAATGVVLLAAPGRAGERWVGDDGTRVATLVRGIGGRDLVLGVGLCAALVGDRDPRPWLLASVGGDVADAAAALALDDGRTVVGVASGFGVLGLVAWALQR